MAAGLLALAAFSLPAMADESPIRFVSGPFAGATAENATHDEEHLSEAAGTKRTDAATFNANGLIALVHWSRLSGGYRWRDSDYLAPLSALVGRLFKANGVVTIRGDRTTVNGYLAQYRIISLTGPDNRCGTFILKRASHLISGFTCAPKGADVPLPSVMEGLSIDGVIGP